MKLFYEENGLKILVGEVITNHSMSVDDMLSTLDVNMDDFADKQGWDGWNFEALKMEQ